MFHALGIVALGCSAWSTVILAVYLRRAGQEGWDAWTMLALSTLGGILSGLGLLLLA